MNERTIDRRTVLKAAAALAASGIAPGLLRAQTGFTARPGRALPPRGEFVIRGATVLTIDRARSAISRAATCTCENGAIVAVAENDRRGRAHRPRRRAA